MIRYWLRVICRAFLDSVRLFGSRYLTLLAVSAFLFITFFITLLVRVRLGGEMEVIQQLLWSVGVSVLVSIITFVVILFLNLIQAPYRMEREAKHTADNALRAVEEERDQAQQALKAIRDAKPKLAIICGSEEEFNHQEIVSLPVLSVRLVHNKVLKIMNESPHVQAKCCRVLVTKAEPSLPVTNMPLPLTWMVGKTEVVDIQPKGYRYCILAQRLVNGSQDQYDGIWALVMLGGKSLISTVEAWAEDSNIISVQIKVERPPEGNKRGQYPIVTTLEEATI